MDIDLKPMVYSTSSNTQILANGYFRTYEFIIVSRGTHPCAYVRLHYIPKKDDIPEELVCVHGGITFVGTPMVGDEVTNGTWIGWDYAHYGDYYCFGLNSDNRQGHKWTTEEILDDVKSVIYQLLERDKKIRNYILALASFAVDHMDMSAEMPEAIPFSKHHLQLARAFVDIVQEDYKE